MSEYGRIESMIREIQKISEQSVYSFEEVVNYVRSVFLRPSTMVKNAMESKKDCETDLVSKSSVLDIYAELYDVFDDNKAIQEELHKVYDKLRRLEEQNSIINNNVHLCNSCRYCYPECSAKNNDVMFGDALGGDNICCCNKYVPLLENDYDRGGYK